ncbi:MAG: nickel pincer cofactor biosynthesis protein LarC, partial [Nitrospirae bacterium]|nr:nickel pincer cofactor biosynthesis protein LarC [Nitrospirota bacterium]
SDNIKQKGLHIFKRLFEAEARVHGEKFRDVHLHELGAADCIVDIFGALIGLDILGIDTIYSSALNVGSGTIRTGHGMLPVPAPATVELLKGIPVYSSGIKFELSTPTGAVLISSLAKGFGQIPQMKISKTGIGAGNKDFKGQPNVLTMIIGEKSGAKDQVDTTRLRRSSRYDSLPRVKGSKDRTQYAGCRMQDPEHPEHKILVIETNIDDMNPQVYEYVMGELFKAGALDVFLTQIIMKKGRPGIKLTVLCSNDNQEDLTNIILKQTTSIGVRFYEAQRRVLERKIDSVNTKFGKIRVKISKLGDKTVKVTPEYEDCRKAARKYNIPLTDVIKDVNSKTGN